jgi:D-hexose-6-phosphate mutarotase
MDDLELRATHAKSIPDMSNNDWENFICIEPVIASKPKILKSGAIFDGTLNIDIIIK